jgi:hypothetical protein
MPEYYVQIYEYTYVANPPPLSLLSLVLLRKKTAQ